MDLKSESLIKSVNEIIDNNVWTDVTDEKITVLKDGLHDIEENRTIPEEEVNLTV